MNNGRPYLARIIVALALIALVSLPSLSSAGPVKEGSSSGAPHNAGILPPGATAFGKTYGEWVALYWQWVLAQPTTTNPQADPTGAFAGVAQSGPVWFLAGTFGTSVTRNVTIPAGKAIFFPVQPWIFGSGVYDCEPTVAGVPCDVPTLRAAAAVATDGSSVVEASIDGVPVNDVRGYRATDPNSFSITVPADNPLGVPAATYAPQVADGYWLLLAPLSPGAHTITSHIVSNQFNGFEYTQIDHITVVPAGSLTAQPTASEFWKSAGADIAAAPSTKRTSWGRVKSSYR